MSFKMWKRLWKNAILALCVLALVFQPVIVHADSVSITYNEYVTLLRNSINSSISVSLITDPIDLPTEVTSSTWYHSDSIISMFYNSGIPFCYISDLPSSNVGFQVTTGILDVSLNSNFGNQGGHTYYSTPSGTWNTVNYYMIGVFPPQSNAVVMLYIGGDFAFAYGSNIYTVTNGGSSPSIPSIDPSNPEAVQGGNYPLNIYTQLGLMFSLNFNCYTPDGSIHFNPSWVGVGQALTYDYLCKTNKESSTVTITLSDGTEVTLDNYLFGEPDYSASLSTIQSTLNTISSRENTTNTRLNTLNTSINTQMNAVNNKLEAAFPSNQAAINDFIAEDLMDDTGGNGLTINRIASSKSDLDDGLDTFKLDTSQSQYSNPFSALDDADWSFWSQTTLNNLGSGYSYSFGEGLLMSEDDVFTENLNDLLNLLGW